jgi:hypothetical protein
MQLLSAKLPLLVKRHASQASHVPHASFEALNQPSLRT